MSVSGNPVRMLLGIVATLAGCGSDLAVPEAARIVCGDGKACPHGWRCNRETGRCGPEAEVNALSARVDLTGCFVGSSPALCPALVAPRGELSACLAVTIEPAGDAPREVDLPLQLEVADEGAWILRSPAESGVFVRVGDPTQVRLRLVDSPPGDGATCAAHAAADSYVAVGGDERASVGRAGVLEVAYGADGSPCSFECVEACPPGERTCRSPCRPEELCGDTGVCAGLQPVCDDAAEGWRCELPASHEADETRCDGLDNDCDGWTDEGRLLDSDAPPSEHWVRFCGGRFSMGSQDREGERPAHEVMVPAFDLARTEMTVAQYRACVAAGGCTGEGLMVYDTCPFAWDGAADDDPMACLSWSHAAAYARWLGDGARLCTEAEWEYAARSGGREQTYPWGEAASCEHAVSRGCSCTDRAQYCSVCSRPAGSSAEGACDLAGNVWEWVADHHHASYDGAPTDGSAWLSAGSVHRVVRGGGWNVDAPDLRATNRKGFYESFQGTEVGARLCRSR